MLQRDQLISKSDQLICTCDQLISTRPVVSSLAAVLSVLTSAAGPAYSSWTLPEKRTNFKISEIPGPKKLFFSEEELVNV